MVKHAIIVKNSSGNDMIERARQCVVSVFSDIPFVSLMETKFNSRVDDTQVDLLADARVSGKPVKFLIEEKSQAEPRLVRMSVTQIKDCIKSI